MPKPYTKEEFQKAVENSTTIKETLIYLGIDPRGANYKTFHRNVKKYDIDISHITIGLNHARNKKIPPRRPILDYLTNEYPTASHRLKNRLIGEGFFEHKCYICNITNWNGEKVPIELDHIDGNHCNNNLTNLRILCPNCHAQTPTYCRSKKSLVLTKVEKHDLLLTNECLCGEKIHPISKRCRSCHCLQTRIAERPILSVLLKETQEHGFSATGRKYGVSDNSIRKWIKTGLKKEFEAL